MPVTAAPSTPPRGLRASRPRAALATALGIVTGGLLIGASELRATEPAGAAPATPPLENLTVRGGIRIVDAEGRVLATLGEVPGGLGAAESVALELHSPGPEGPRETVRLESLSSGAMVSVQTPDRSSSMTLVSSQAGPFVLLTQGEQRRVIGSGEAAPLPSVDAGPRARDLDLLDPRAQPVAEGLAAVGMHVEAGHLRGRILNSSSVRHTDVEIEVEIGTHRLVLGVPIISPGNSTGFSAALPDGMPDAALRSVRLVGVISTLQYDAHQPWSASATLR